VHNEGWPPEYAGFVDIRWVFCKLLGMPWNEFNADSLHEGAGYLAPGFIVLSIALMAGLPAKRRKLLALLVLFLVSMAGLFLAWVLANKPESPLKSVALVVQMISLLGEGLCVIAVLSIFLFTGFLEKLHIKAPRILQDVLTATAYLVWGLLVLNQGGVNLAGLIATSAVLTAVIGFAMQDTLGNILAGIGIQLDKSVQVGDWVVVDGVGGRIVQVGWRHTSIETRNWETLIMPNSVLMKNKFLVLGRRQGQPQYWRRWVWFHVDFRFPPAQILEVVTQELRTSEIPLVVKDPPPNVVLMDFSDSFCKYAVRYWLTDFATDDPTDSQVRVHIYSALKRAGIPLSIPAHAIFVTEETQERKDRKADEDIAIRVEILQSIDLFKMLTEAERHELAEHLRQAPFSSGRFLTKEGEAGDWLYIIVSGQADVVVTNKEKQTSIVAQLRPGQICGEWSLMTGEPRHATIVARNEMLCYRLDAAPFKAVLNKRPALAEGISALLAKRRMELEAAKDDLDEITRAKRLAEQQVDILDRIKRWFQL